MLLPFLDHYCRPYLSPLCCPSSHTSHLSLFLPMPSIVSFSSLFLLLFCRRLLAFVFSCCPWVHQPLIEVVSSISCRLLILLLFQLLMLNLIPTYSLLLSLLQADCPDYSSLSLTARVSLVASQSLIMLPWWETLGCSSLFVSSFIFYVKNSRCRPCLRLFFSFNVLWQLLPDSRVILT